MWCYTGFTFHGIDTLIQSQRCTKAPVENQIKSTLTNPVSTKPVVTITTTLFTTSKWALDEPKHAIQKVLSGNLDTIQKDSKFCLAQSPQNSLNSFIICKTINTRSLFLSFVSRTLRKTKGIIADVGKAVYYAHGCDARHMDNNGCRWSNSVTVCVTETRKCCKAYDTVSSKCRQ
jgi:hypothetical protein